MGFIDGIRNSVSNVVNKVEAKVVEAEKKVADTAGAAVEKVEELGHKAASTFDPKPSQPNLPPVSAAPASGLPSIKGSDLRNGIGSWLAEKWNGKPAETKPPDPPAPPAPPPAPAPDPAIPSTDPKQAASGANYKLGATNNSPLPSKIDDKTLLGNADGPTVMENFSQANGFKGNNMERCGPTSAVGAALAKGGPKEAAKLAKTIADSMEPTTKEGIKTQADLRAVAKRLDSPKATYGDLGELSTLIHQRSSIPNGSGGHTTPYGSETQMFRQAGNTAPQARSGLSTVDVAKPENFDKAFPPGQAGSWPANVAINGAANGNHWVTIGRDKDGRAFVYDPMPKEGQSQVVYQDKNPLEFKKYQNAINSGKDGTGFAATN